MTPYTYSIESKPLLQALLAVEVSMPTPATEPRSYLCGVRVELIPGLCTLVTTDGHRMGSATLPAREESNCGPVEFTILGEDLKALILAVKDAAKSSQERCTLEFTPAPPTPAGWDGGAHENDHKTGELWLLSAGRMAIVRTISRDRGKYPDWRRVMPKVDSSGEVKGDLPNVSVITGAFNCGYIADMAKACGAIMKGDKYGRMNQYMLPAATLATATNGALEFSHVVMALRSGK